MNSDQTPLLISKDQAAKFMVSYHQLQPPYSLRQNSDILAHIQKVGCIQFDPVDVIGRSPDLALHARVRNYKVGGLDKMLYEERTLLDGFDKVQSVYAASDHPFFSRRRAHYTEHYKNVNPAVLEVLPDVLQRIKDQGPLCSLDLPYNEKVQWSWGEQKVNKAALEVLSATGRVIIHHRVRSRRYFDLAENCLPPSVLQQPDPFSTVEDYQDAHILRRIGGLGLASMNAGEMWLGMLNIKSPERNAAANRLLDAGKIVKLKIEGLDKFSFLIRSSDLPLLQNPPQIKPQAVFVPPLDNFMWDRKTAEGIFGFKYIWEIYKPAEKREYGYYVLPVVYGNKIAARFDAKADRKNGVLNMVNWWFEPETKLSKTMAASIRKSIHNLSSFLSLTEISFHPIFKEKFSTFYGILTS